MTKIYTCMFPALFTIYAKNVAILVIINIIHASISNYTTFFKKDIKFTLSETEVKETQSCKSQGYKITGKHNEIKSAGFNFGNLHFLQYEKNIKEEKSAFAIIKGININMKNINTVKFYFSAKFNHNKITIS